MNSRKTVKKTVNKQSHIQYYQLAESIYQYLVQYNYLPYLAQYITLHLPTRTTLYFGVWQVLFFFQFTTTCPLLFSNIIKILQEFGSDLENFNNYTHCRFEPMTCAWRTICFKNCWRPLRSVLCALKKAVSLLLVLVKGLLFYFFLSIHSYGLC